MSNKLEQVTTTDPYGNSSDCGKFTVDSPTTAFLLSKIATVGQTYTFNCWVRSNSASSVSVNGLTFPSTTGWTQRSVTFVAEAEDVPIVFGNTGTYYIYHPKLERGNKPTDWTPAPEDVEQDRIEATDSIRNDIVNQNAQLILDCKGLISEAEATYVKIDEYGEFTEDVRAQLSQIPGQISVEFEKTITRVNEVDGALQTTKNSIAKHIEFSSENAITIGGSSGIVLTVDNDNGIIFSKIVSQTGTKLDDTELVSSDVMYQVTTTNTEPPTAGWLTSVPKIPSGHYLWIRRNSTYADDSTYVVYSVAFGSWDGNDFYTGNIVVKLNERAQLGNFAFVPRSDGSLSFLKVGG